MLFFLWPPEVRGLVVTYTVDYWRESSSVHLYVWQKTLNSLAFSAACHLAGTSNGSLIWLKLVELRGLRVRDVNDIWYTIVQ